MSKQTVIMEPVRARHELEELLPQIRNQDISRRCSWLLSQIVAAGGIASPRDFERLYPGCDTYRALAWLFAESLQHDWEEWDQDKLTG